MKTCLLGIDIGSSSIKAAIIDATSGKCIASVQSPESELDIKAQKPGWAEQNPEIWWEHAIIVINRAIRNSEISAANIKAIGITYQMHGLVCIDKAFNVLRDAIIWCDSRAVDIGHKAFDALGHEKCLSHLLNSPGNFTASKIRWVIENEPEIADKIFKIMLPGDFIALKLTGEIKTTISGLSEGIMWDHKNKEIAGFLLDHYQIDPEILPDITPSFGQQGKVTSKAAHETGLIAGTPVSYRAGDQPNNAFSVKVINPGEIAATAGTSGVVYGVTDLTIYDPLSRVNAFVHVNNTEHSTRNGILLCINGTGIMNSWVKKIAGKDLNYEQMNLMATQVAPGSEGLLILPFGNGAERILNNKNINCSIHNLNFNFHGTSHIFRAVQEGIAFSFNYGIRIIQNMGLGIKVIKAGKTNMFLSPLFCETLANISGVTIELYNTDGAQGAARGAGIGAGIFTDFGEAFKGIQKIETIHPASNPEQLLDSYQQWESLLTNYTKSN